MGPETHDVGDSFDREAREYNSGERRRELFPMPTLVLFPAARRIDPPDIGEICPEICLAPWGVSCTLSRKFFEDRIESRHVESCTGA